MATVFTVFRETDYQYLTLSRGNVFGNTIKASRSLKGVFKERKGYTRDGNNMETLGSDMPTLHAHPEDFEQTDIIVGNGVIVNGNTYEITGITYGKNFATGVVEHITMTLREANYGSI